MRSKKKTQYRVRPKLGDIYLWWTVQAKYRWWPWWITIFETGTTKKEAEDIKKTLEEYQEYDG